MPARKPGIATPSWLPAPIRIPEALRCRTAAIVPSGIAIASATIIAVTTRMRLTCSLSKTSGLMSCLVMYEVPKSPVMRPPTQSKYWM